MTREPLAPLGVVPRLNLTQEPPSSRSSSPPCRPPSAGGTTAPNREAPASARGTSPAGRRSRTGLPQSARPAGQKQAQGHRPSGLRPSSSGQHPPGGRPPAQQHPLAAQPVQQRAQQQNHQGAGVPVPILPAAVAAGSAGTSPLCTPRGSYRDVLVTARGTRLAPAPQVQQPVQPSTQQQVHPSAQQQVQPSAQQQVSVHPQPSTIRPIITGRSRSPSPLRPPDAPGQQGAPPLKPLPALPALLANAALSRANSSCSSRPGSRRASRPASPSAGPWQSGSRPGSRAASRPASPSAGPWQSSSRPGSRAASRPASPSTSAMALPPQSFQPQHAQVMFKPAAPRAGASLEAPATEAGTEQPLCQQEQLAAQQRQVATVQSSLSLQQAELVGRLEEVQQLSERRSVLARQLASSQQLCRQAQQLADTRRAEVQNLELLSQAVAASLEQFKLADSSQQASARCNLLSLMLTCSRMLHAPMVAHAVEAELAAATLHAAAGSRGAIYSNPLARAEGSSSTVPAATYAATTAAAPGAGEPLLTPALEGLEPSFGVPGPAQCGGGSTGFVTPACATPASSVLGGVDSVDSSSSGSRSDCDSSLSDSSSSSGSSSASSTDDSECSDEDGDPSPSGSSCHASGEITARMEEGCGMACIRPAMVPPLHLHCAPQPVVAAASAAGSDPAGAAEALPSSRVPSPWQGWEGMQAAALLPEASAKALPGVTTWRSAVLTLPSMVPQAECAAGSSGREVAVAAGAAKGGKGPRSPLSPMALARLHNIRTKIVAAEQLLSVAVDNSVQL